MAFELQLSIYNEEIFMRISKAVIVNTQKQLESM